MAGGAQRLLGALALLGSLAFWNQTREASIDGPYGCACGLAVLSWTGSFLSGRRSWALWLMPGLWMGLAMLLKGPAALLLVVLLSVCVLRAAGEGRAELKRPGLWAGVALTLGIFFTWVALKQGQAAPGEVSAGVPTAGESMWAVWKTELGQRLFTNPEGGKVFRLGKYLERVLSGLATLLPWLALVIWAGRPSAGAAPTGAGAAFCAAGARRRSPFAC